MHVVTRFSVALTISIATSVGICNTANAQTNTGISDLGPLQIKPGAQVDETLFLMRFLETTYAAWPPPSETGIYAARWAVDKRLLLKRLVEGSRKKKLDVNVIELLEDCEKLFQSYDDYLVEIGVVERASLERAREERGKLVEKGAERLFDRTIDKWGGENAGRQIVGETAADLVAGFVVDLFQQAERNDAKMRAIKYAQAKYEQSAKNIVTRAISSAGHIAKQNKWTVGEVGFDDIPFEDQYKRRPRDPFIIVLHALIRVKGEKANDLIGDARACVEAARLVPEGLVYDPFRAEFLMVAGDLAELAASREWLDDPKHSYGGTLAKEAVRICRTRLAYDSDPTDWGKYDLAKALNFAGLHKESLTMATSAKKLYRDAGFAYDYACLLSVDGQTKLSLDWLEFSFKLDGNNVAWAKIDPELANLRREQADGFGQKTKVKFKWKIEYGTFNDDIVLTNNSPFPLTNVSFTPKIRQQGETYTKTLTAVQIGPGQSYTWKDVFSIPGSASDSATGTLLCDQFGPFYPTVVELVSGSVAERAKFRVGDRIISYDGASTARTSWKNEELEHLKEIIVNRRGREVCVQVVRDGAVVDIRVRVPEGEILGIKYELK